MESKGSVVIFFLMSLINFNAASSNNVLNTVVKVSVKKCLDECALRSDCQAVNYRRRFLLCELLSDECDNFVGGSAKGRVCVSVKRNSVDFDYRVGYILLTKHYRQGGCQCLAGETCDIQSDTCSKQECRSLTLENGNIFGNMISVGSTLAFQCNQGYTETGTESNSTCLKNGTWSYYPQCKRECNEPQPVGNATLSNAKTYEGLNKTYTCQSGLLFSSGRTNISTTCQSSGQWSRIVCPTETDDNKICTGCILPRDCQDVHVIHKTAHTGVFNIYPTGSTGLTVRCDMDTSPGGWTVIQRRISDSDFYKTWNEYKDGFGNLSTNFWLGNDKLNVLSNSGNYGLRVDLIDQFGDIGYMEYKSFSIGDESSKYRLNISTGSGPAGDSLHRRHDGMKFSTRGQDNDIISYDCSNLFKGGWWYRNCQDSNLNGLYGAQNYNRGMTWKSWKSPSVFMKFTEMKIRRQ